MRFRRIEKKCYWLVGRLRNLRRLTATQVSYLSDPLERAQLDLLPKTLLT